MVTRALLVLLLSGCAAGPSKIVFHPTGDGRPTPPVIVDPKPDAVIIDARPIITLALPPGTAIAHVEICRDEHCEALQAAIDTSTTKAQAPAALPSGIYWLRVSARAGERFGKTGPLQRVAIERRATVHTEHFDIDGPGDSPPALEELGRFLERTLAFDLAYLGLPAPSARLAMSYYATEDGYHFATHALEADKLADHGGFTRLRHSYIRWVGNVERALVPGAGLLEYISAHELAHQVQCMPNAYLVARMPPWLREASADFLAELALASIYKLPEAAVASLLRRHEATLKARREQYAIPVKLFLEAKYDLWQGKDRRVVALAYSEGYTLLRSLGAPAERMRAFLRELWSHGANVDLYVGPRLRDLFGGVAPIQQTLDAWLDAAPPAPYDFKGLDMRLIEPSVWHLQTPGRREGTLLTDLSHPATATVELDAELEPTTKRLTLLFGGTPGHPAQLELWNNGRVRLLGPQYKELGGAMIIPPSGRHRLRLVLDAASVTVHLDDAEVLRAPLSAGAGRLGLQLWEGRVLVHSLKVLPRS